MKNKKNETTIAPVKSQKKGVTRNNPPRPGENIIESL